MKLASLFNRNLNFFLLSYFSVLLNYPFVRASSTTFFFEAFGAKSSPTAWLWGVLFLSLAVYVSNRLQTIWSVQKVFLWVSAFSFLTFAASAAAHLSGMKAFAYVPFIWKEIYIVLQVHLLLAYFNSTFRKEDFKVLVGLVGGVGSVGGIIGGWLTSYLADRFGTAVVMGVGDLFVLLPGIFFLGTTRLFTRPEEKAESPLSSFTPEIGRYVATIALIVAFTQFIINIADFNFHLVFEANVTDSNGRTSYLGNVYMLTNAVTFIFQFLVLPWVLLKVSERSFHLFIPLSYLAGLILLLVGGGQGVLPMATYFTYLKASDYSLFSAGKELLYQPLTVKQKYGAKYLTDMLVYRTAKALIAAVLIYLQTSSILNALMVLFLFAWIYLIIRLFRIHRQLFS